MSSQKRFLPALDDKGMYMFLLQLGTSGRIKLPNQEAVKWSRDV